MSACANAAESLPRWRESTRKTIWDDIPPEIRIKRERGIERDCVPVDHVIVRVFTGGERSEHVDLGLRMADTPFIVGLSD